MITEDYLTLWPHKLAYQKKRPLILDKDCGSQSDKRDASVSYLLDKQMGCSLKWVAWVKQGMNRAIISLKYEHNSM